MAVKKSGRLRKRPDIEALLNPRNIPIVGASDKPGNWAERSWNNLNRYGFKGAVYPVNPNRDQVWGVKCYASLADLPEKPDHVLVLVPARFVSSTLKKAAAAGARSATIISSGFGELPDDKSIKLGEELADTIRETGLAVSGPNCLANFNGGNRVVTMVDNRTLRTEPGPVAIVGQSGGLVMALKRTLEERGMDVGYIVISGNEAGLKTAVYIEYFAANPQIKVIVFYLESVRDSENFLAACEAARSVGKPVIVLKLGTSDSGRAAAMAHTGALAGSIAAFDAIAGDAGVIRVSNLDDVVEASEYFLHAQLPKGNGIGAITFSGGLRGLLLDQAETNNLSFPPLKAKTKRRLGELLGVGSIIGNPLDSGFAALNSEETYINCVKALLDDPGIHTLMLQEEIPRAPGAERKVEYIRAVNKLAKKAGKPITYVTMISHSMNEYSRDIRNGFRNVAFLQEADKALRAIRAVTSYAERKNRKKRTTKKVSRIPAAVEHAIKRAATHAGRMPLSEIDSKKLIRAYGLKTPMENLATSAAEATEIARKIGMPVVLKVVGAELTHKSDVGGVLLNNNTIASVRQGFSMIRRNVTANAPRTALEGVLVAEQVSGEVELVIGALRDPEMGPLVMFGSGGVALELYRDVAFAAPTLDETSAKALIGKTAALRLMRWWCLPPELVSWAEQLWQG